MLDIQMHEETLCPLHPRQSWGHSLQRPPDSSSPPSWPRSAVFGGGRSWSVVVVWELAYYRVGLVLEIFL